MKLTEELKQQICDLIEESLNNAKLQGLQVEDEGGGFPLVDYLSYEGKTILKGKEEIANIVEQIYFDMDSWDIELQQYAVINSLSELDGKTMMVKFKLSKFNPKISLDFYRSTNL